MLLLHAGRPLKMANVPGGQGAGSAESAGVLAVSLLDVSPFRGLPDADVGAWEVDPSGAGSFSSPDLDCDVPASIPYLPICPGRMRSWGRARLVTGPLVWGFWLSRLMTMNGESLTCRSGTTAVMMRQQQASPFLFLIVVRDGSAWLSSAGLFFLCSLHQGSFSGLPPSGAPSLPPPVCAPTTVSWVPIPLNGQYSVRRGCRPHT